MSHWKPLSPSRLHRLPSGYAFGLTHTGHVRQSNEDNFLLDERLDLAMVGDGMGGHAAGEVASAEALDAVWRYLTEHHRQTAARANADDPDATAPRLAAANEDPDGTLPFGTATLADPEATAPLSDRPAQAVAAHAVSRANARLYAMNQADRYPDGHGIGTTLTGIWRPIRFGPMIVFHVGDSRLYRWRDDTLTQITTDHTLYQQALDQGGATHLPPRNLLLQAVGPSPEVAPEIRTISPHPDDLYLLCSDGLHGMLEAADIQAALRIARRDNLQSVCERLIEQALAHGGKDNVTAILVWCDA